MEAKLRRFLWAGTMAGPYNAKVGWDEVCHRKSEGGLGIRNLHRWNQALMARHIWNLFANRRGNLWTEWVHAYFVKDDCFWSVVTPSVCSWNWRQLLKLRPIVRPLIRAIIGNGRSVFLWKDIWLGCFPLFEVYGPSTMAVSGLQEDTRLSSVIVDSSWVWLITFDPSFWAI